MPCVYTAPQGLCDGTAPLSRNEHYLPRALGNFRDNEPLVDRICENCQRRFAQLEDVFAHNSSEAFFREMVGRVGRKNHRNKNIFYEPTMGIPPLAVLGRHPGHEFEILWEPVGQTGFRPMSQLVFIGRDGRSQALPFRRGVTNADKIRRALAVHRVEPAQIVAVPNSDEEAEEMQALTDELLPGGRQTEMAPLVDGAQIDGQMNAPLSAQYLRAVAKIAFHYFLNYFPQFSGLEGEFDNIKRFIYTGQSEGQVVLAEHQPFILELQAGGQLKRWGHFLSAEITERSIEARVQFFAGPPVQPFVWRILIGRNPARIIYNEAIGYAFLYFEDVGGDFHGERVPLRETRRVLIPRRQPILKVYRSR